LLSISCYGNPLPVNLPKIIDSRFRVIGSKVTTGENNDESRMKTLLSAIKAGFFY
jgi:hypothetical protein